MSAENSPKNSLNTCDKIETVEDLENQVHIFYNFTPTFVLTFSIKDYLNSRTR